MVKQTESPFTLQPLLLFMIIFTEVEGDEKSSEVNYNKGFVKLFVFGDSYVDTGNFLKSGSYKPPNGHTFPGKPAGRFGDGRILTDFIASFMGIRSPVPYRLRHYLGNSKLQYGMNFACGGTGILNTFSDGPNMTSQIDSFQRLIEQNVYTKHDLTSSVALLNAGGNDYATYGRRNGTLQDMPAFTSSLVNQLSLNLKRIQSLGVTKIAVALMMPMGCLPQLSQATSYQKCVETPNMVSKNHNQMLLQSVANMNHELGKSVFITLDIYNAFISIIHSMQKSRAEHPTLINPLEPCVKIMDKEGARRYIVCGKPELSFFWDNVHPSQNGWHAVYQELQSSLNQLVLQEN